MELSSQGQSELRRYVCSSAEAGETGVFAAHGQQEKPAIVSVDGVGEFARQ